jgi:hypothetical protein
MEAIGSDILMLRRICEASFSCLRIILGTTAIRSLGPVEH